MRAGSRGYAQIGFILLVCGMAWSEEPLLKLDFSGATPEANQVTTQGAGFGAYPQADVSFGGLPIDNTFEGATDGTGLIITADPGEGVMVFAPKIATTESALVRVSVRTDSSHAAVTLATIGEEPDRFLSYNAPGNETYFQGQYLRLQTFCVPPSGGFQPLIQVHNTSPTESLTAFIDNFEVFRLDPNRYYSAAFLDGDEIDPPALKISLPGDNGPGVVPPVNGGVHLTTDLSETVSLEMVCIRAGTYIIGATEFDKPEHTQRPVTLVKDVFIGRNEVTQAQWKAVMGPDNNPSFFKGDNRPVENVSWTDCQTFVQKLNEMGVTTFRLPTRDEWEIGCRAGTTTRFYWGNDESDAVADRYVWYYNNSSVQTHDVGSKRPNDWGFYDMSGNVLEWCQDLFLATSHTLSGGDFRSFSTDDFNPVRVWITGKDAKRSNYGFRLALDWDY